ncbi:hypothetical protein [Synechococcus sp. PCC 7336]|uniref:hypothetical protein n=1 Tax=Synechococcus sp. PCC 7336 TaxID=195250 RepID=UPI0003479955|nr:hypothetical protein [Synechococcus sp. PCC 7336]
MKNLLPFLHKFLSNWETQKGKSWLHNNYFLAGILCLLTGLMSFIQGWHVSFDLMNYQYYNNYAWLNNVLEYHFSPGQVQSFHNPLLWLPYYLSIRHLPTPLTGFLIGLPQGLNLFLIYWISTKVFPGARVIHILSIAMAMISPMYTFELGSFAGDNICSIFVLAALTVVVKIKESSCRINARATLIKWLFCGLLIGIASGLKLTNLTFLIPIPIVLFIQTYLSSRKTKIAFYLRQTLLPIAFLIFGFVLGFLCTSGLWMYFLYSRYENPLFPYYNAIFKSEYFQPINLKYDRWIPDGFIEGIKYVWFWLVGKDEQTTWHWFPYRDAKWFLFWLLLLFLAILKLFRLYRYSYGQSNLSENNIASWRTDFSYFLVLYSAIGFTIWLYQFGYIRYLLPLDIIAGIVLFFIIEEIVKELRCNILYRQYFLVRLTQVLLVICLAITSTNYSRIGNFLDWPQDWFGVQVPSLTNVESSMILMYSRLPYSYIVPYFPVTTQFVRFDNNMESLIASTRFPETRESMIQNHTGPFYGIFPTHHLSNETELEEEVVRINASLGVRGMTLSLDECIPMMSNIHEFRICPITLSD